MRVSFVNLHCSNIAKPLSVKRYEHNFVTTVDNTTQTSINALDSKEIEKLNQNYSKLFIL